ncbi:hypothetical protein KP509_23G010900 [Ceratopteris richardii]|uniref:Glycosyltransferase n=1 Tax=Ceratopteris richardii TaxID=49495 RepID=A0A8T2RZK3_CERRI|nr:hypothetical protein KP509_23G010900 [Ceratopteris richardii]
MATSSRLQMRGFAFPLPAQSHMSALMRLCETLSSPPHDALSVNFVNVHAVHERLIDSQHRQNGSSCAESDLNVSNGEPCRDVDRRISLAFLPIPGLDFQNLFQSTVQTTLNALDNAVPAILQLLQTHMHQENPVTCVFSDICIVDIMLKAMESVSLPRAWICSSSASFLLFFHYLQEGIVPMEKVMEMLENRKIRNEEIFQGSLPGLPTLTYAEVPQTPMPDGQPHDEDRYIYNVLIKNLTRIKEKGDCILVNSFEELEPDAFTALRERLGVPVYAVGPLRGERSTSLWNEDNECLQWLDQQPAKSVVYISSGSLAVTSPLQVNEFCEALLREKQRFLWVHRTQGPVYNSSEACPSPISTDFLSQTQDQGRTVQWAPQRQVLRHSAVAAFVSHCGWNSTIEAVECGVPILCLPLFYDQFMDAKLASEVWKMGVRLSSSRADGVVDRDELQRAFAMVSKGKEGEELRSNARRLQRSSDLARLEGGSSYTDIQLFIKRLRDVGPRNCGSPDS